MITHAAIWAAIDELANAHGLSPSALARRAGLDPTTFNRSKRFTGGASQPRWPSMRSVALVLNAVDARLSDFAHYVENVP